MNWEAFGEVENSIVGVVLVSLSEGILDGCRISIKKTGKFQLLIGRYKAYILILVLEDSRLEMIHKLLSVRC